MCYVLQINTTVTPTNSAQPWRLFISTHEKLHMTNKSLGVITRESLQKYWEQGFKYILYNKKNNLPVLKYRDAHGIYRAFSERRANPDLGIMMLANQNVY